MNTILKTAEFDKWLSALKDMKAKVRIADIKRAKRMVQELEAER